jgi:signal transduction histidine kinase
MKSDKSAQNLRAVTKEAPAMSDTLILLDNDNYIRYCSDTAWEAVGLDPDEAVGQPVAEILLNKLSDLPDYELANSLLEMIADPTGAPHTIEVECSLHQPKEFVITVFPLSTALEGVRAGVLIRDVTRERETERRRDTFIAVLSHELRDPITALMGFTRMLLEKSSLSATEREWLENVHICGRRLNAMTRDLLDVVGIRSGKLTVRLEPVRLAEIIDEVLPVIEEAHTGSKCVVNVSEDVPVVMADRTRLAQVLVNLLSNAVKYSPKGREVKVCAYHEPDSGRIVVAVNDQGSGISPQEAEHIFTPFQRSHRLEKQGINGVGLGLYIVKGLVELMHGKLWLDSEVGKGSTFYFSLPTCQVHSHTQRLS